MCHGSGNLEAAIELGAYAGLQLAWVPVWSAVLGFCLQDLASRVGLASGQDLAQLVRERYPRWCARSLYVCLEFAVVSADIQEVIAHAQTCPDLLQSMACSRIVPLTDLYTRRFACHDCFR